MCRNRHRKYRNRERILARTNQKIFLDRHRKYRNRERILARTNQKIFLDRQVKLESTRAENPLIPSLLIS